MPGRVLLVTTDGERAGAIVSALRADDVRVTVVDGAAGCVRERRDGDRVDCVVVDHDPPAVDGPEVANRVTDRCPGVGLLLAPGSDGDEALAARAVDAGVDAYVPGDDERRLRERVAAALDGSDNGRGPTDGAVGEPAPDDDHSPVGPQRAKRSRPDGGLRELSEGVDVGVDVDGEVPGDLKERVLEEAPVGVTVSDPDLPDNPLVYVNEAFEEMTGYDRAEALGTNCRFLQGEGTDPDAVRRMATAVDADEPVSVEVLNYRKDGEEFWNRVDIAPIRDDDGEVTNYVGFQTDVTERKRAEFAVERYAEQLDRERAVLDRVVDRVQGLVRDAAEALVTATTRREVADAVCSLIAETDSYDGAWMSELDMGAETLSVTTAAGLEGDPVGETVDLENGVDHDGAERAPIPDGATPRDPAVAAVTGGEPQTVGRVADLPAESLHRDVADDADALAAVPVEYRDTCYGVLTVYAEDAAVVDERERTVVAALGRMIATAINAAETKTTLAADDVVSLEFEMVDPDLFFVGLSGRLDCSLDHAGTVSRDDGSCVVFVTVRGASGDSVVETALDHPEIEDAAVLTEAETETLVELTVADGSVLTDLADYGARLRSLSASAGTGRIEVEAPPGTTARSVADHLESFEGGELVAYHEDEVTDDAAPTTRGGFVSRLRDRLTDRQLSALQRAYLGGYFEWPRDIDGDELAGTMDVSRSTYHQHLRAAERKLLAEVFADRE